MGTLNVGVRLHDLLPGTVEERIALAGHMGFTCIQLPTKVLYASYGIDRTGLTHALSDHLCECLDAAGVRVAVLGCYKNLAVPDENVLADQLAEYEAALRFASWLGGCPVGTETGRPNVDNKIADDRFLPHVLKGFTEALGEVVAVAEDLDGTILIEPGWNEVVCTVERCRFVLDAVPSKALGVIFDPVSLLHPRVVGQASALTARMLHECGERIRVLHAKDYEVVDNESAAEWCDGSGSRLVCRGAGETGAFDFSQLAVWTQQGRFDIDCIVENGTPETLDACRDYLLTM